MLSADGTIGIVPLLTASGAAPSNSEAARLIRQGGVKLDGVTVSDREFRVALDRPRQLQVGKRRFLQVLSSQ